MTNCFKSENRSLSLLKIIKSKKDLTAIIAVRTLWARRVRAVNTLQQLLPRRRSVMDAVKKLWERRVDAVRTL